MLTKNNSAFQVLVADLRDKIPFRDISAILKAEGVGTAIGWEKLIEKLDEHVGETKTKVVTLLKGLQQGLTVAGTKAIFVYELDGESAQETAEGFAELIVPTNVYSSAFPRALSESSLKQQTFDHELAAKITKPNGDVTLVFCAKRFREERVIYKTDQVTDAVREAFAGYDEFIAVKRTDYQIFDLVTIRSALERIEVLIDHPDRISGTETAQTRCLQVLGRLSSSVAAIAPVYEGNSPVNLLPCINALYSTPSEGRVSRLFFRTPTKSVNRAALLSEGDLRIEAFHAAGVTEVGQITPYDVTVVWSSIIGVNGPVSVQIGTNLSGLTEEDTYVRNATIIGARDDSAIIAIGNKLVSFANV